MSSTTPATMREHWKEVQGYLQVMTTPAAYECWLAPLTPQSYANGVLTLAAPDARVRDLAALRLDRVIRNALYFQLGRHITVEYVIQDGGAPC